MRPAGRYGVTCDACVDKAKHLAMVVQQLALPLRVIAKRGGISLELASTAFPHAMYTEMQERDSRLVRPRTARAAQPSVACTVISIHLRSCTRASCTLRARRRCPSALLLRCHVARAICACTVRVQFMRHLFEALAGMVHPRLLDGIGAPCAARNAQGLCTEYAPAWLTELLPGARARL